MEQKRFYMIRHIYKKHYFVGYLENGDIEVTSYKPEGRTWPTEEAARKFYNKQDRGFRLDFYVIEGTPKRRGKK